MATSRSTNQYARHGNSSPSAGAYIVIPVTIDTLANGQTRTKKVKLPAGMKIRIVGATAGASTVTSDPAVSIGSLATVTKYVAAVNLTSNLGALTMVSANQETAAGETIVVQAVADANDAATDCIVNIFGFVTAHPTAAPGS